LAKFSAVVAELHVEGQLVPWVICFAASADAAGPAQAQ
jgi:hypothetical protein